MKRDPTFLADPKVVMDLTNVLVQNSFQKKNFRIKQKNAFQCALFL